MQSIPENFIEVHKIEAIDSHKLKILVSLGLVFGQLRDNVRTE